jgi:hypothetical protein
VGATTAYRKTLQKTVNDELFVVDTVGDEQSMSTIVFFWIRNNKNIDAAFFKKLGKHFHIDFQLLR